MLTVEEIDKGTVIDHIPSGKGLKVLELLKLAHESFEGRVALVMNVPSKKLGRKDIVKVEGTFIDEKDASRIALVAPEATINIIKGGKVAEKNTVRFPKELTGIIKCPNPKCITNHERALTHFHAHKNGIRCMHCERLYTPEELQ